MVMCFVVFLCFKVVPEMGSFRTRRFWSCNISWQSPFFVCLFVWLCWFPPAERDRGTFGTRRCELSSDGPFLLFAPLIYLLHSSRESLIFLLHHPRSSRPPAALLVAPNAPPRFFFFFFSCLFYLLVPSWLKHPREAGCPRRGLRAGPTVGIVSEAKTIFSAALSGLPGNKASIDPPNEPTQQSLLLDLYLLKSGQEKSGSFSTFPGIRRLIDCFARAASIFWNAGDWKILNVNRFIGAVDALK